jgi:phosphoribosylamine-glycine ligase|tara:strand:+ start:254 stop:553 length:300 start_codon:yes stop_codon:yes gene_type:complete
MGDINMAIYRITRFTSSDMDKAKARAEEARDEVSAVGADFIEIAADADGNGVVVAKYPDAATMEAATATAQKVFGQMVAEGVMDGDSISIWTGDVINSM